METEIDRALLKVAEDAYQRFAKAIEWVQKLEKGLQTWKGEGRAAAAEYFHAEELLRARGLKLHSVEELVKLRKKEPTTHCVETEAHEIVGEIGENNPIPVRAEDVPLAPE